MITAATALVAGDLPVATTSAKGAVQITSGGGLTIDGSGNLTTSTSGVSAGTYQSVTVNNKGVITAGAALTAGLIPDLAASKITSGSLDAARIGNDTIDGTKLSNTSTTIFQSIAQSGYPTAQFNGQLLFDTVSEDAFIWDGTAWQAITTLTKGSLVFGGTYNASTSQMVAVTSAGAAAGLTAGANLPSPSQTTDGVYVVISVGNTAGNYPSSPAPQQDFSPPDYILGVSSSSANTWQEIDLSATVAGQVASNITFQQFGTISAQNVQDAIEELDTEKLAKANDTVTGTFSIAGQAYIKNTGSLVFEGATDDAFETTLTVEDPTTSDKTITFPDTTGTVITTGDTGTVTGTMIANDTIQNTDIKSDAAIAFSKLASVASGYLLVGNGASPSVAAAVAVTGDISINNAGLTSIAAGVIVDADISGSAAITGSKIATGTTSAVGVLQLTDSATSTSATTAATPAAVKIAKDAADAAATTANAALPKAGGVLTGHLTLDDEKELRFREEDAGGDHYIALKAAAALAADVTLTLPAVAPTAGQVLKADASTPTTLTWAADSATDSTKMPLAGGTFTGDVTFTGDSSDGLWDKSASAFVANLTGNVTGNVSGSSGSCTGNAATATNASVADTLDITGTNTASGNSGGWYYPLFTDNFGAGKTVYNDQSGQLAFNPSTNVLQVSNLTVDGDMTLTGAANNVVWDKSDNALEFADMAKATFGADADFKIYHSGSTNFIEATTHNIHIDLQGGNENAAKFIQNGAVELFHNGIKRLETQTDGIKITAGEGEEANITFFADEGDNATDKFRLRTEDSGGFSIESYDGSSWETCLKTVLNSNVELYHDGTKRFETTSAGATVSVDSGGGILKVQGAEGGNVEIWLQADEGDDDVDNWLIYNDASDNKLKFASKPSGSYVNQVIIDSSGNVGIGVSPDSGVNLHIKDSAQSGDFVLEGTSSTMGAYVNLRNNDTTANNYTSVLGSDAGGQGTSEIRFINKSNANNEGEIQLLTRPSGGSVTTALTLDSSQNATFAGTVSDDKGNLRSIPKSAKTSSYTLVAADGGKCISMSGSGLTLTILHNTMTAETAVTILNDSANELTLAKGASMTLYNTADGSTPTKLAARGMATVYFAGQDTGYISGAGLS